MVIFDTAYSTKHINIFYESHDISTACLLLRPEEIEDSDFNYCNCAKGIIGGNPIALRYPYRI